jgi:general stress protein 26
MSSRVTLADVYRFVSDPTNKLAVLSSIASGGSPQSALIGIAATSELEIFFDTVRDSRKYANLIADSRCAFVIGTNSAVTVQYEGVAREVTEPEQLAQLKQVYFGAFPDGPSREAWPGIVYFAVKPTWLRFSDYGETPPVIETLRF